MPEVATANTLPDARIVETPLLMSQLTQTDFGDAFVQEFISNPFLINGYKFDITVTMVITSMLPLKIYVLNGRHAYSLLAELRTLIMEKLRSVTSISLHVQKSIYPSA